MHQTRSQVNKKIPIQRKGTKYVVRPLSHLDNSVPVAVAVRDMLKLAKTLKEVKYMIQNKLLKINGREVKDYRESIKLMNIFEADKIYFLSLTPNGKFQFKETKEKTRYCKVLNKTLLKGKNVQLNLHDGSNIITKDKINTHDTLVLDEKNKLSKHIPMEKGKICFIISGKYLGKHGKIELVNDKVEVKLEGRDDKIKLEKRSVLAL
ncbi:hypothetical protein J4462_02050 [Candidatus Pacearchaeota archaeon]|nr:hypothetical protein [Candidatus Pacearchaeota archaeon]